MWRNGKAIVKDLEAVLQEKELDVARVRREVEALRAVVPLLDDPLAGLQDLILSGGLRAQSEGTGMEQLELYYPFVKKLRSTDKPG